MDDLRILQSYETKRPEQTAEFYLQWFGNFQVEYSDYIPPIDTHTLESNPQDTGIDYTKLKCRGNNIGLVMTQLCLMKRRGIVADEFLCEEIDKFTSYRFNYLNGKPTTEDEITMLNAMIDKVIEYLRNETK